jgi:Arc/MetJ family transcription regulator
MHGGRPVTTVQITLPDQLAAEAQKAGLLTSPAIERLLREQIKARRVEELFEAMDRMAAVEQPPALSPEEVAEELRSLRAERQSKATP